MLGSIVYSSKTRNVLHRLLSQILNSFIYFSYKLHSSTNQCPTAKHDKVPTTCFLYKFHFPNSYNNIKSSIISFLYVIGVK